jgi:hypothetical protein
VRKLGANERLTGDGIEATDDEGVSWHLIEPSREFLAWRTELAAQLPDPDVELAAPDLLTILADMGAALAPLTASSTAAAQRAALLNMRAVIDNALP